MNEKVSDGENKLEIKTLSGESNQESCVGCKVRYRVRDVLSLMSWYGVVGLQLSDSTNTFSTVIRLVILTDN